MNRKILFSTESPETFEIQRHAFGYRILQVLSETEAKQMGNYATAGELLDGLAELAIFSGDDAVALADVRKSFRALQSTLSDYLGEHYE